MPDGTNGRDGRVRDLNAASSWERRVKPTDLTPDEARALIDRVFMSYGLDPVSATDPHGWRHLSVGSANGVAGVVEWQPGDYYLGVLAPVFEVPADPTWMAGLYKLLLELNHHGTLAARFSIHENTVFVVLTRPIRGLDEVEVDDAIRSVMTVADSYDEWLRQVRDAALARLPIELPKLPNIKMSPQEAWATGTVLAACDPHGQEIFRYLMERWHKSGYVVDPGTGGVSFKIEVGSRLHALASVRPGVGARRQLIILGWEGLREKGIFAPQAIDKFQSAVLRIANVQVTESTAHLEVTEAFGRDSARALLGAMRALARSARPAAAVKFEWDPSLPQMDIRVGPKTLAGIQETLQACAPRVQQMYALLIEGWQRAGGTVQCSRPGRIYLKFKSREHKFGKYGVQSHLFNLVVLAAPKGKRELAIDVSWNLARGDWAYLDYAAAQVARFEATVASLPGFEQQGTVTRLVIGGAFQMEHAETLLKAMLDLKAAGGADQ